MNFCLFVLFSRKRVSGSRLYELIRVCLFFRKGIRKKIHAKKEIDLKYMKYDACMMYDEYNMRCM